MKHARMLLAAVLAVTAISLTACGGSPASVPTSSDPASSASDSSAYPDYASVVVGFAADDAVGDLEYIEPEYADSEYLSRLAVTTDAPIQYVQLLDISLADVDEEGNASFRINEVLDTQDSLEPGQTLILGTVFEGDTPTRGISYSNSNGEVVDLAISLSGMDGSLIVEPVVYDYTVADEDLLDDEIQIDSTPESVTADSTAE